MRPEVTTARPAEFDLRESHNRPPRFGILSAVYNVARYLPDLIASIERQSFDLGDVEVIMVDDGSTDESLDVLREWEQRRPGLVTVLSKPNGGQGSARNLGLEHATAEWVTFVDPDDWVDDDYFTTVDAFIQKNDAVMLIGTYRIFVDEPELTLRDRHPLRDLFRGGNQLIDLDRFPDFFHGSAPSAFLRRSVIEEQQLRFDDRVQPNFEDGHFCARYLLGLEGPPLLGLLASAQYFYRKRSDLSSTLQNSLMDPRRFIDVPRYGYLGVLRQAMQGGRAVPQWLKNMLLYEISFYFSSDEPATAAASAGTGDVGREFVEILGEIVGLIGEEAIAAFSMRKLKQQWIDVLTNGLGKGDWHTPYIVARGYDRYHEQVRLGFQFRGSEPQVQFLRRGQEVEPAHQKIRTIEYFGQQLLFEKLAWIPASGTLRVTINGQNAPLRKGYLAIETTGSIRPSRLQEWFGVKPLPVTARLRRRLVRSAQQRVARARRRYSIPALSSRWTLRISGWLSTQRLFRNAWVLMDRIHDANDSAEVLFLTLRRDHRNINAWFVLKKGTPDWDRLKPLAGRRLLPHGSLRWKLAILNCRHLISSHVDQPILRPPEITRLAEPTYQFTFLQHGVIKDDLSRWLNDKALNLFITSTEAEYESIAGDNTPYVYTSKEVKLTGLPRFDALTAAHRRRGEREPDLLLIAPTWRQWLNQLAPDGSEADERSHAFEASEYFQNWRDVLTSDRLQSAAASAGLSVAFLPHPNIRPAVRLFNLDSRIPVIEYSDPDLHDYFARAAVLITDYSSMAFNAAYLEHPVVYFQFDSERVKAGGHLGRQGYFEYERDGFGPVAESPEEVFAAVESITTGSLHSKYRDRITNTFPFRDGKCSERVIEAIRQLG
jgi:glycosyltransferase involved in cell wall biosynthesis